MSNPRAAMSVTGLMLTLSSEPELAARACAAIRGRAGFELGERQDRWLPLVAEAADDREAREAHRWLESLPGVDQVGVILVAFEQPNC